MRIHKKITASLLGGKRRCFFSAKEVENGGYSLISTAVSKPSKYFSVSTNLSKTPKYSLISTLNAVFDYANTSGNARVHELNEATGFIAAYDDLDAFVALLIALRRTHFVQEVFAAGQTIEYKFAVFVRDGAGDFLAALVAQHEFRTAQSYRFTHNCTLLVFKSRLSYCDYVEGMPAIFFFHLQTIYLQTAFFVI